MKTYLIKYELYNGLKSALKVDSDSIAKTLKEIEETFDNIGTPVLNINYEQISQY